MDVWNQDYLDPVVPGYIEIEPDGQRSFQFGTVSEGLNAIGPRRQRMPHVTAGYAD